VRARADLSGSRTSSGFHAGRSAAAPPPLAARCSSATAFASSRLKDVRVAFQVLYLRWPAPSPGIHPGQFVLPLRATAARAALFQLRLAPGGLSNKSSAGLGGADWAGQRAPNVVPAWAAQGAGAPDSFLLHSRHWRNRRRRWHGVGLTAPGIRCAQRGDARHGHRPRARVGERERAYDARRLGVSWGE